MLISNMNSEQETVKQHEKIGEMHVGWLSSYFVCVDPVSPVIMVFSASLILTPV